MTPFRQHREAIGWSIQHTADRVNVNERAGHCARASQCHPRCSGLAGTPSHVVVGDWVIVCVPPSACLQP